MEKQKTKIIQIFLIIIFALSFFYPILSFAQTATQPDITLQVPLLGYAKATDMAEYIKNIYQALLYIIIPFIIIMIIASGILWIIAGGDKQLIGKAKHRIQLALIGLGIALFSYVLLSFVGITQLIPPSAEYIETIDIPDDALMFPTNEGVTPGGTYQSVGGQCFPVPSASLKSTHNNFAASRAQGARKHAGVDIYTNPPGEGIAIADGVVLRISTTFKAGANKCTATPNWWISQNGGSGDAGSIYIYFPSLNVTVNYGENDVSRQLVKVGQQVKAGQVIGIFGPCRMLHFELYQGRRSTNIQWKPADAPQPAGLIDPTKTLSSLPKCK
ncbi:MAG: M23 family metallopeptidase [Patescibacteria group bacterium]